MTALEEYIAYINRYIRSINKSFEDAAKEEIVHEVGRNLVLTEEQIREVESMNEVPGK